MNAGMSKCPVCEREWLVTPFDDCMLPACGCFGTDTSSGNPNRICHNCGMAHARTCNIESNPTPNAVDLLTHCPDCGGELNNGFCQNCKAAYEIANH